MQISFGAYFNHTLIGLLRNKKKKQVLIELVQSEKFQIISYTNA